MLFHTVLYIQFVKLVFDADQILNFSEVLVTSTGHLNIFVEIPPNSCNCKLR